MLKSLPVMRRKAGGRAETLRPAVTVHQGAISKMASTSTGASNGREGTPMVERAWMPSSPKSPTARPEALFMILAWLVKAGAQLINPPRRTTLLTRSRFPRVAFAWATTFRKQACAQASQSLPKPHLRASLSPSGCPPQAVTGRI